MSERAGPPDPSDLYRAAPGDPLGGLVRRHFYVPDVDVQRFLALDDYQDELLREFTLIRLGRRSGLSAADYPYRLLEVIDEIITTYSASRHDIRRQAVEALARGDATLTLHAMGPNEAAPMAARFGELLDEIRRFSQAGDLLTVPPSEEQAEFNRGFYGRLASHVRDAKEPVPGEEYAAFIASMAMERGAPAPMPGGARIIELPFDAELAAPPVVRRMVRDTLQMWGRPELSDQIDLPVTELLSNVVLHTGQPGRFVMIMGEDLVRVEVHDSGGALMGPFGQPGAERATGYGLALVEATTSRWGTHSQDSGKVVWFEIDTADSVEGEDERDALGRALTPSAL